MRLYVVFFIFFKLILLKNIVKNFKNTLIKYIKKEKTNLLLLTWKIFILTRLKIKAWEAILIKLLAKEPNGFISSHENMDIFGILKKNLFSFFSVFWNKIVLKKNLFNI